MKAAKERQCQCTDGISKDDLTVWRKLSIHHKTGKRIYAFYVRYTLSF
jgi:hypothetical protein